jgi:hypothetical protein
MKSKKQLIEERNNMTSFLTSLPAKQLSRESVDKLLVIENKYQAILHDEVKMVLELGEVTFIEYKGLRLRFIGLDEIIDAEEDLHVPFTEKKILPLFDLFENDFICYNYNESNFCVYNIIDKSWFFVSPSLEEVINKLAP